MGFLDDLKKNIETGVNAVSSKSKEMIDSTKTKFDIDALKKQKRAVFEEIGSMVYQMNVNGNFNEAALKEKCEAVTVIENQIKTKEAEATKTGV
jgi:hypothetical protein